MTQQSRRLTSTITLAVSAVAVVIMGIAGFHKLTAPIPNDTATKVNKTDNTVSCQPGETEVVVRKVHRSQVVVSVYNAGKKAGRAGDTMSLLEDAGFVAGAVGNAPAGSAVVRAEVHTKKANATAAKLVALALGKNTPVIVDESDLGPGINVFIGDKFRKLDKSAPTVMALPTPNVSCH
jgi:hypothetical protein